MSSPPLPSRRFREVQLLIGAALVMLVAVVVAQLREVWAVAQAGEEGARRSLATSAHLLGELAATRGRDELLAHCPRGLRLAIVTEDRVERAAGDAGPTRPAWWPWESRAEWEAGGRPVVGPLPLGGVAVGVAYQPLSDGRVLRVVGEMATSSLPAQWRWIAGGFALLVAGGGGLVAWLLLGRALAPYRELLAEAARVSEQPAEEAEDRFLLATFRAAIQRLELSEASLRQRVDELAVLAGVLTRESRSGVVILAGDGSVRAANAAAGVLTGEPLPADVPAPAALTGEGTRRLGERLVEVRRFPLRAPTGEVQGEVLFLTDHTQVEALERSLREREGMAVLGELSAGMAHELRNALATIRGYVRLLTGTDARQGTRYLAAIEGEAIELTALLDRFLSFAQPPELERVIVDLLQLAGEAAGKVRAAHPGLALDLAGSAAPVAVDPLALGVVLENLLRNAAEATGGRGDVRVRVEALAQVVQVAVEDDGPGVSEEVRPRLFTPFVTTKPSGGLGLAVARRLARLHGGEVAYTPTAGGGACFVLTLPRGGER